MPRSSSAAFVLAVLGLLASPTLARAGPASVALSRVLSSAPASRTVAIQPAASDGAKAAEALAAALTQAGYTVVAADRRPALIVGYVVQLPDQAGNPFPIFTPNYSPQFAASDADVSRRVVVAAWRPDVSRKPTRRALVWVTAVDGIGLSKDRRAFLPAMLRAGAPAYGRTQEPVRPG